MKILTSKQEYEGDIVTEILNKVEEDIRKYVESLNTPENIGYHKNELLIKCCFTKSLQIIEENGIRYYENINK